jgi:hypothetical protein
MAASAKNARRARRTHASLRILALALALVLTAAVAAGCGYRAVYGDRPSFRLHVKLVRTLVPDVVASDEVAAGVREELARSGVLQGGEGYPRVEIEVLRADEASEGIAAGSGPAPRPVARSLDVGISARAWIVRAPDAAPESDTGDLRAEDTIAVDETEPTGQTAQTGQLPEGGMRPDPRASAFHSSDALRAAARRLGRRLAYKVTGEPAASDDGSEAH